MGAGTSWLVIVFWSCFETDVMSKWYIAVGSTFTQLWLEQQVLFMGHCTVVLTRYLSGNVVSRDLTVFQNYGKRRCESHLQFSVLNPIHRKDGKVFKYSVVHTMPDFMRTFSNSLVLLWQAVLKMLAEIGTVENIPDFLEGVKNRYTFCVLLTRRCICCLCFHFYWRDWRTDVYRNDDSLVLV